MRKLTNLRHQYLIKNANYFQSMGIIMIATGLCRVLLGHPNYLIRSDMSLE